MTLILGDPRWTETWKSMEARRRVPDPPRQHELSDMFVARCAVCGKDDPPAGDPCPGVRDG